MYKTATVLGREHRSHNHLNLLQDSFIRPLFENVPPVLNPSLHVFIFGLAFNNKLLYVHRLSNHPPVLLKNIREALING